MKRDMCQSLGRERLAESFPPCVGFGSAVGLVRIPHSCNRSLTFTLLTAPAHQGKIKMKNNCFINFYSNSVPLISYLSCNGSLFSPFFNSDPLTDCICKIIEFFCLFSRSISAELTLKTYRFSLTDRTQPPNLSRSLPQPCTCTFLHLVGDIGGDHCISKTVTPACATCALAATC